MLSVLKETKDYIVVNKPGGLITERNPYEDSLESQVYTHLLKTKKSPFLGVVHRLDRVTSGVVLFAKKKSALQYFNGLFEKRQIRKTYLAITAHTLKKSKASLSHYLKKDNALKKALISNNPIKGGKLSELGYVRLGVSGDYSVLKVLPKTGRFHQIRAQLSHMGIPIYGDKLYGAESSYLPQSVCLHAFSLEFKDFNSKESICIQAPIPNHAPWDTFVKLVESRF